MSLESGTRRFAGNVAWLVVGDAIAKIASFVFVIAVARGLSAVEYGYFNFSISFLPLFLVFAVWGLDDALFRDLAHQRERISQLVSTTFLLRLVLAVAAVAVAILIAPALLDSGRALLAFSFIAVALLLDELGSVLGTVFKAFEKMRFRAIRILVNRIVTTALALGALWAGGDLIAVCAMYVLGSLIAFLYAAFSLWRHFPAVHLRDANRQLAVGLLKKGAPLAVAGALSMAVFRIDAVMLQGMKGPVAVAMYGVAYRFLDSLLFVAWGLANSVLPRLARARDQERQARAFEAVLALCLAVYLPLGVGAWFAGGWAVRLVFGERYSPAAEAVVWLLPAAAIYGSAYVARMACLAIQARKQIAVAAAIALGVNVAGNVVAIPRYGIEGAAAVTFFTGAIELAILTAVFWRATAVRVGSALPVPVMASALLAVAMLITRVEDAAAVAVGTPVYLVATLAALLVLPAGSKRWWRDALSPESDIS